jgi:hypothetical protein
VCLLLVTVIFYFNNPPAPAPVIQKVTELAASAGESGESGAKQKPDLRNSSQGKLTGRFRVAPAPFRDVRGNENLFGIMEESQISPVGPGQKDETTQRTSPSQNGAFLALNVGDQFQTELTGEIRTRYRNAQNNIIGAGAHPVTAELITAVRETGLDYQLQFTDTVLIEIDYKPPDPPQWIFRLYLDGAADIEYRPHWMNLWGVQGFGMARYVQAENQTKITVGIEFSLD